MYQLNSQPMLPSKQNESTHLSQDVALSWVSTEVDYISPIEDKPTKQELKLMGNAQKDVTGKWEKYIMDNKNEGMKRENFHLKKQLNTISNRYKNNYTIETKSGNHGNTVSMYETVK